MGYIRERGRAIVGVGAGALALAGAGYLASLVPEARAFGSTPAALAAVDGSTTNYPAECAPYRPDTVSVDYVDNAVLPLAREVIGVYHHAKRSQKKRLKASELYDGSDSHLTEIDVAIPARWPGHKHKGTYNVTAQFTGSIIANKMVAVQVEEYPGHLVPHGVPRLVSPYNIVLEETTRDGADSPIGPHWHIAYDNILWTKCGVVDSLLANGDETSGPSMTKSFFDAANQQAIGVIKRMEQHKPLMRQKNVAAS